MNWSGFAKMPKTVLYDCDLSPGARLLYASLVDHAGTDGDAWPGQERLATLLGFSVRQVRRFVADLRKAGLVSAQRRGFGDTNLYVLQESSERPPTARHSEDTYGPSVRTPASPLRLIKKEKEGRRPSAEAVAPARPARRPGSGGVEQRDYFTDFYGNPVAGA